VGRELDAITLTYSNAEVTEALTDNYVKLWISGRYEANQALRVRINRLKGQALEGRVSTAPA
jgi:hypothetical protein